MHVLVAGCGWLGTAVARRLIARGDRVTGVRSDPGRAEALRAWGIEPLCLDLAAAAALEQLPGDVEAILALQAPGAAGGYQRACLDVNGTLLQLARRAPVRAYVYTSSTGIFCQRDGSEVDEGTAPELLSPSSQLLAQAEALLLEAAADGLPARVVRLSGLYGPGRLWMLERVRSGAMALGPGDRAWLNSCHQDDAVATLLAALDRGRAGAIYHASDAEPMRRREVIQHVADRLGLVPAQAAAAPPAEGPDRRVQGQRTRAELGLQLAWPSLRAGLEPYLAAGLSQSSWT